jgi:2-keto-4-pentenoate hydratase/2-oxohepta-3-ene-1,7-dioic acid hydratase in catechol pathway
MTYVRYLAAGRVAYGILSGGVVEEISAPPFAEHRRLGRKTGLSEVKILAPCEPSKIFAMAGNYLDHLRSEHVGEPVPPEEPKPFVKVSSSVIGPGDTIVLPREQELVEEEAELVVVIGKPCRRVSPDQAMGYVFGYTCGNDVSARAWQKVDRNWWRAKSADTFTPLGPSIVTGIDGSGLEARRCSALQYARHDPRHSGSGELPEPGRDAAPGGSHLHRHHRGSGTHSGR